MKKILFVFGTRPEALKLAPLIKKFQSVPDKFVTKVCVTSQHKEMLSQVVSLFEIHVDYDLGLMKTEQTLIDITAQGLIGLETVFNEFSPDLIFVQGDTTSAFVAALAGYYYKIDVAHVEAGLRSHDKFSPFPEEMNRSLISRLADYHFVPTESAKQNLLAEGISKNIYVTGNTVIDALLLAREAVTRDEENYFAAFPEIDFSKKLILVTGHRRESFGPPFENICKALLKISTAFPECVICYPVHLNPQVQEPVKRLLSGMHNIHLIPPQDYLHFVFLMNKSYLILTDSGGVQEEAPSLGKPVLVMRHVTERIEGIEAGTAELVGTGVENIFAAVSSLLCTSDRYERMVAARNPYGDGTASQIIFDHFAILVRPSSS